MNRRRKVTAVLFPDPTGGYVVYAPVMGVASQGETKEEALRNIKEAIEGVLELGRRDDLEALELAYAAEAEISAIDVLVPSKQRPTARTKSQPVLG